MSLNRKYSSVKDRGPTITIPNIPKITDVRSRMKLMCEYEKYEAELFKHHLGTADTTCTMSVKQAPTDFDRRVPGFDEPTIADVLYDRRRCRGGSRWASERKINALRSAAGENEANAGGKCHVAGKQGTGFRAAPDSWRNRGQLPTVVSTTPPDTPNTNNASNLHSAPCHSRENVSVYSPLSIRAHEESEDVLSSPGARRRTTRGHAVSLQVPQGTPPNAEPTEKVAEGCAKGAQGTEQGGKLRGSRRSGGVPVSALAPHPPPVLSNVPFVMDGAGWAVCAGKDYSSWTTDHCAEMLRVLLKPPLEYGESFKVDMRGIDLRWMWKGPTPKNFTSLQSWRVDKAKDDTAPVINSPRSALVILRCGITVADLLVREVADDAPLLPKDPEERKVVKSIRMSQNTKSVKSILDQLRVEYSSFCSLVSLSDLVEVFRTKRQTQVDVFQSTMVREAMEKQKRLFECAERKLEVEAARAKSLRERERMIEQRNERLHEMMVERVSRKKEEEMVAQQNAIARLQLQQQRCAEREKEYQRQLQERLERADERNARQQAMREHLLEERRVQQKKSADERRARMERMAEVQEKQSELLRRKYEERDAKLQFLQDERERKQRENQERIAARAAKSRELREQARQRALLREEEVRLAALGQQQQVEKRLQQLTKQREEDVIERAKKESLKKERLKEVLTVAAEKLSGLKEEFLKKQEHHKERYDEIQRNQAQEAMLKRERERDITEARAFTVLQKKRAAEFNKVEMVLQLIAKREATEALEAQREMILRESSKSRAALTEHKNSLMEDIAAKRSLQG